MKLLSSLCVCHGVAMRDKQRLIYKHLLNCSELLVQTSQHPKVHRYVDETIVGHWKRPYKVVSNPLFAISSQGYYYVLYKSLSLHPDLYVGMREGSAAYRKWYYEVQVTASAAPTSHTPHLRVGWAHATLFRPYPCSNGTYTLGQGINFFSKFLFVNFSSSNAKDGGIGDDVFSLSYDGTHFWMGGTPISNNGDISAETTSISPPTLIVPTTTTKFLRRQDEVVVSPRLTPVMSCDPVDTPLSVGDVIGCCIDLESEVAWFTKNGESVKGHLRFHDMKDMITPAVSFSSGVKYVRLGLFSLGNGKIWEFGKVCLRRLGKKTCQIHWTVPWEWEFCKACLGD